MKIIKKDIIVRKKDIAYIKFFLEGYEGLATITTVDNDKAVIRVSIMSGFASDFDKIFEAIKKEIALY